MKSDEYRPGRPRLGSVPLITAGAQDFILDASAPTPAAGDLQILPADGGRGSVDGGWRNTAAYVLGFDSMSEVPAELDTITEDAGDGSARVLAVVILSGDVTAGDAAGLMFVDTVSGTWTDNSTISISGGTSNVATVDATTHDIAATAGLFAFGGDRAWYCLTPAETELDLVSTDGSIQVRFVDSATKAWEDTYVELYPASVDLAAAEYAGNPTGVTSGAVTLPSSAPASTGYFSALYIAHGPGAGQFRRGSYSAARVFTPFRAWTTDPTTASWVVPIASDPGVDLIQASYMVPMSIDLAGTATVRIGVNLRSASGDLPATSEITPGTISIDAKGIGETSWTPVVVDAAMSEGPGHVYYDEVFDAASGYAEGDSVRVTFKSVSVVVDNVTHEVVGSAGVQFQTEVRQSMRGTDGANTDTPLDADGVRSAVGMSLANLDTQIGLLATEAALTVHDGKLDIVDSLVDTLIARLTATRAGFLDNLGVGGLVASSAEVTSVQNNTRVVRVVPSTIERPNSGTQTYRVELLLYDEVGNMEVPDSAPTIELVDQDGNDLSGRLDSTTMALVETGRYRAIYTASDTDELEQLVWAFGVVEGGVTRKYGNTSIIVDTVASDFTAADRAKLDTLHDARLTAARAALLDNLDAAMTSRASADKLKAYVQLALRSDAAITIDRAAEWAEINANEGSGAGSYDVSTDSQEKIGTDLGAVVVIASGTQNSANEIRNDLRDNGRLDVIFDAILGDTDELQQAWADGGRLDSLLDDALARLPAATVDGLTPTQRAAVALAAHAGRIVDPATNPIVIQNPDGTETRITATPNRGSVTLSYTGV